MTNYQEAIVKLTNAQLNKLKSAAKSRTGAITKTKMKNFQDEELPHESFLTTIQTTKIRNPLANNMLIHIKLSKVQISKIIQSVEFSASWLGNLGKKALANVAIPLARDDLPELVSNLASKAIN